jgi:hypothetical protein
MKSNRPLLRLDDLEGRLSNVASCSGRASFGPENRDYQSGAEKRRTDRRERSVLSADPSPHRRYAGRANRERRTGKFGAPQDRRRPAHSACPEGRRSLDAASSLRGVVSARHPTDHPLKRPGPAATGAPGQASAPNPRASHPPWVGCLRPANGAHIRQDSPLAPLVSPKLSFPGHFTTRALAPTVPIDTATAQEVTLQNCQRGGRNKAG